MTASVAVSICSTNRALGMVSSPSDIRMVAVEGQTAPGTSNAFGTFISSPPSVNVKGDVAFRANYVHQGPEGIWAERGSLGLQTVAVAGQTAPGTNFRTFDYFGESNPGVNAAASRVVFNKAGQIAFRATLGGSTAYFNNDGAWLAQPSGEIEFIARSGARIAGSAKSVVQIQHNNIALNHQGDVSFRGRCTQQYSNDGALFTYRGPGTTAYVGATFDLAPNETGVRRFSEYAYDGALIDSQGRSYFVAFIGNAAGAYVGDRGIYRAEGTTLTRLARDDEPASSTSGVSFDGIYPFNLAINSRGDFAFASVISGPGVAANANVSLFRSVANGPVEEVLRRGAQAPGMAEGVQFDQFYSPEINKHGQLAFLAKVRGVGISSSNDEMVWIQSANGDFRPVAQEGVQAAEAPANVSFGDRSNQFDAFRELAINANGQVAFAARLRGAGLGNTSGNLNDTGLWATDMSGALRSIVIAGQPFQTSDGHTKSHGIMFFAGNTGNDDGLASGFSDSGHVAFHGYYGNAGAVYVSSKVVIPEPATALMLVTALVSCTRRKR